MRAAAFDRDLAQVVRDRPDFVTLNEVYSRSRVQLEPVGYASWHPAGGPRDQRDTAVLWRKEAWRVVDRGVVLMHERPVKWGTRYVTWVTLRPVSGGARVSVIAAHASPGGAGREGLYGEFRTRLVALTKQLRVAGPVLVGGDLNVGYPRLAGDARTQFEEVYAGVGARTTYSVLGQPAGGWVTDKGGGTIDYILTAGATPTRHWTGDLAGSDHRTVSATITLGKASAGGMSCDSLVLTGGAGSSEAVYPVPSALAGADRRNWGGHSDHWDSWHTGTDFSLPCGTPVLAATAGTIQVDTSQAWSGTWLVKVSNGPGRLATWYAHMQRLTVSAGQRVRAGQQIGEVGARGNATGCHLHFEVHLTGGSNIYGSDNTDPSEWLASEVIG
ncbi:peptidoglycan DD-metalloendopeptidase family protein [Nocardioides sp. NPDC087217]|uniref:peptidoglycan DD-metalloendopeptidase family protein n=1 Tax=Nocardioides sp. NPDC087217 TaxID=3364335 RepID=UPI0038124DE6